MPLTYEIALVNPRKVSRKRKTRRRNPAMKRNKKGRFVKARRTNPKRRKHTARKHTHWGHVRAHERKTNPRRRRRRRNPVGFVTRGQRRRRRRYAARAVNPRRHRRRNPRFSMSGIKDAMVPALFGAAGAVGLDIVLGYVPLPAALQSQYAKYGVKIAGSLAMGWAASKVLGRQKGMAVGAGALTVTAYGILRDLLAKFVPSLGVSGYEEISLNGYDPASVIQGALPNMGAYMQPGVGAYIQPGVGAYMEGMDDGM